MAKTGRKEKDKIIQEGFNEKKTNALSKRELAKIKSRASKEEKERKRLAEEERQRRIEDKEEEEYLKEQAEIEGDDEENIKSAYKMLKDLRWVYKEVKGRKKLKNLALSDDKQFIAMVKELMRIEASLLSAKAKQDGEGGQKAVFVVLKGLEKPPEITSDKIDVKQITQAMTPDGGIYGKKTT